MHYLKQFYLEMGRHEDLQEIQDLLWEINLKLYLIKDKKTPLDVKANFATEVAFDIDWLHTLVKDLHEDIKNGKRR